MREPVRRGALPVALATWLLAAAPPLPAPAVEGSAPLAGIGPSALSAQEWKEFRSARHTLELRSLELEVVYGAGELRVAPAEGPYLYDLRVRFDASRFRPMRSWSAADGRGRLRIALASRRGEAAAGTGKARLDDFDLDFELGDLEKLGGSGGRLELRLGREVPTDLRAYIGAAESELRLGGLPLANLELHTGASETRLSFEEPNPIGMERLELKVGAAEFRAEKLGNARFERFRFEGGVGDVLLDFTGAGREAARGSIRMGIGGLTIRVPAGLGVRIRRKSFLASFDAPGFTRVGDAYQSSGWDGAGARLELDLEAALGTIKVEVVP